MHDPIQQASHAFALHDPVTREAIVLCASLPVYLLLAGWIIALVRQQARLTIALVARIAVLFVLAYALSKVAAHLISDPRPYIADHEQPLAPIARDNGFPSDHTLLAAALTASVGWFERRLIPLFAAATLLVIIGRLGIAAHHTPDVLGSLVIVAIAAFVARVLPLPLAWKRHPLSSRRHARRT